MDIYIKNLDKHIKVKQKDNLLKVLQQNGIKIPSSCGGNGTCKKCLVYDVLSKKNILSCQTQIMNDMVIITNQKAEQFDSYKLIKNNTSINPKKIEEFAMVVDIGTTTLAVYLISLPNALVIQSDSCLNPQSQFGADVINRINQSNKLGVSVLNKCLIDSLNQYIEKYKEKYQIKKITNMIVSGNTTMQHTFMNINPKTLGYSPYKPVFLEQKNCQGKDLGLDVEHITVLPSIGSFVGADITMGIIACNLYEQPNTLLVDLGTNGEIVLNKQGKLFATSTAAGPALEGTNIECGSGGIDGAITKVTYKNQKMDISYLGEQPKSITGSALIDVHKILLDLGIIDKTGALNKNNKTLEIHGDNINITNSVYVSQKDIRQFQLAKSAIRSGIDTILKTADMNYDDLNRIYISGGFGFYLDIENAIQVGLLPKAFKNKIVISGNTSAFGAIKCLKKPKLLDLASIITKEVEIIDLTSNRYFNDRFIENLFF